MRLTLQTVAQRIETLLEDLSKFPWRTTAQTLRERFREDQLGLTASSLTFTTVLALVPFLAVALAVFTAFPIFGKLQGVVQKWLVESLVPDSISRQVLGYLTQFAAKASGLGALGFSILLGTALMLIRRDVLEGTARANPDILFRPDPAERETHRLGEFAHAFFYPMIDPDTRSLLSDDYAFCRRARDAGFRIWLAPWVRTTHAGPTVFSGTLADTVQLFSSNPASSPE